jgi:hypothetical protein
MDWLNLLNEIFNVCIIPLLGILTKYFVEYLSLKRQEISSAMNETQKAKYIAMLIETIEDCINATNQTYVDSLKASGSFDKAAQEEAFKKTYDNIMLILSEESKKYLAEIYGDLDIYIKQKIEAEIKKSHKE